MSVGRVTISLPGRLAKLLGDLAQQWGTTRSDVVKKLLEDYERRQLEALMREGYQALADENLAEVEEAIFAQSEVVLRDL